MKSGNPQTGQMLWAERTCRKLQSTHWPATLSVGWTQERSWAPGTHRPEGSKLRSAFRGACDPTAPSILWSHASSVHRGPCKERRAPVGADPPPPPHAGPGPGSWPRPPQRPEDAPSHWPRAAERMRGRGRFPPAASGFAGGQRQALPTYSAHGGQAAVPSSAGDMAQQDTVCPAPRPHRTSHVDPLQ